MLAQLLDHLVPLLDPRGGLRGAHHTLKAAELVGAVDDQPGAPIEGAGPSAPEAGPRGLPVGTEQPVVDDPIRIVSDDDDRPVLLHRVVSRPEADGGLVLPHVAVRHHDVRLRGLAPVPALRPLSRPPVGHDEVPGVGLHRVPLQVEDGVHLEVEARHPRGLLRVEAHHVLVTSKEPRTRVGGVVQAEAAEVSVVVTDRLDARHAGADDLPAAAEPHYPVEEDGADADLEVALHNLAVHVDRRTVARLPQVVQHLVRVVVVNLVLVDYILPKLLHEVQAAEGAVAPRGDDEPDVVPGYPRAPKSLDYGLRVLAGPGRPAHVIEDDHHLFGLLRNSAQGLGAKGVLQGSPDLSIREGLLTLAGHPTPFHIPNAWESQREGLVSVPLPVRNRYFYRQIYQPQNVIL